MRKLPNARRREAVTRILGTSLASEMTAVQQAAGTQLVGEHGASSRGNSITDSLLLRCCS